MEKSKYDKDYTDTVKSIHQLLSSKYGYTARISNIFELIKDSFGLKEFEILDTKLCNNGLLESFLIDKQKEWLEGKQVNFSDIYEAVLREGDFTASEKLLFNTGNIEERLWAIFLTICSPQLI